MNIMILTMTLRFFSISNLKMVQLLNNETRKGIGVYLPYSQKWVKYSEGIEKYGLEPCYSIHNGPFDYKGYIQMEIPKGEDVLYPFIDFIYESWGLKTLGY